MNQKISSSLSLALVSALISTPSNGAVYSKKIPQNEENHLSKLNHLSKQFKRTYRIAAAHNVGKQEGFLGFGSGRGKTEGGSCYINSAETFPKTLQNKLTCGAGKQPSQDLSSCVPCPKGTYSN
ncbi:MAG: hypothetical protein EOM53_03460, partial [Alphaproteobacteria bacterium]|nr:hypothetical protein [Alphaproteobacteria bacterium]